MKKLFLAFIMAACFVSQAQGRTLADALLELYADEDPKISAGAMLLTIEATNSSDYTNLIDFIIKSRKPTDTDIEKFVKTFVLARKFPQDLRLQKEFIGLFPQTWEKFWEYIEFEQDSRPVMHSIALEYLFRLAESRNARIKLLAQNTVHVVSAFADGWIGEQFDAAGWCNGKGESNGR